MDVREIRLLEGFSPARKRVCGIGVVGGKAIQCFLLDDVHLGWNIATCYIDVNRGRVGWVGWQPPPIIIGSVIIAGDY